MPNEDDPFAELIATGALVLLVGAVIAGTIGAVEWGRGSAVTAMLAGAGAAIGFAVSMACFMSDARRDDEAVAELPFPSWLRNEADA